MIAGLGRIYHASRQHPESTREDVVGRGPPRSQDANGWSGALRRPDHTDFRELSCDTPDATPSDELPTADTMEPPMPEPDLPDESLEPAMDLEPMDAPMDMDLPPDDFGGDLDMPDFD